MNFFQHQDQARKNTRLLIVLFCLAVCALIAITTAFVAGLLYYFEFHQQQRFSTLGSADSGLSLLGHIVDLNLVGSIAAIVVAVVGVGSGYRLLQLRGGGETIAAALGGRRVQPNSGDLNERKLLNVVEEMAIASGTPVPPVFIIEEDSINAFAAGINLGNAVIGVTRGCMQLLNREQLQGVIAHEFSHILHGDMKINLRLLGVLHGILVIGLLGTMMMRGSGYRRSYSLGSRREKSSSGIALLGLGLFVIGYAGTFSGKLIKAALSRQREFLADASAVQYTRNPRGIGEALCAIGTNSQGSRLAHPRAEEFSHMYFGAGVGNALGRWLATHPPLEERIRRINPHWDGSFAVNDRPTPTGSQASDQFSAFAGPESATATEIEIDPLEITANPGVQHVHRASELVDGIPATLREAAREPFSARAVIYNLLLQPGEVGDQQWQRLQSRAHPAVMAVASQFLGVIRQLPPELKLPLFELTIPALKTLSGPQARVFQANVVALIKADQQIEIFEWALYRMLRQTLQPSRGLINGKRSVRQLGVPVQRLLSTLSRADNRQSAAAAASYAAAMAPLNLTDLPLLPTGQMTIALLDDALDQLQDLKPLQKPALLKAMLTCINHDQKLTTEEYELFRAVADCLDCPAPPLLHTRQ